MKTDALIATLARDAGAKRTRPAIVLALAAAGGLGLATSAFLWAMGPRADLVAATGEPFFLLKIAAALLLALSAYPLVVRAARPGAPVGLGWLWVAPALVIAGAMVDLAAHPPSEWLPLLVGRNARVCLTTVPALAALPLLVMLLGLRHGATTRPVRAGALAGVLAGALGAMLYATHCTDDSPLFVLTWYSAAIALCATAGALLGRLILRW